jgi:O-antigen ligase
VAGFFLWLLVLVPPFLLSPVAKENFRQPKLLASEWFALASLVGFAWGLRRLREVRLADLWRLPAVRVAAPILLVATATLATTRHPLHAREGLIDLWIGAACLVGWSVALPRERLERLLHGLLVPATALALLGIVQFHGWWQPLGFFGLAPSSRMAITSLAGNPGDLGAYLVLPVLIAQAALRRRRNAEAWSQPTTWATAAGLAVCVYGLLITQTLSAIAALTAGSLLLWWNLLPRRRALGFLAAGAVAATVLVAAVSPLRERVVEKTRQVVQGDLNAVLTGRLDGWRTAVWMLREHPLTGVGHGAYRTEYVPAKLALLDRGAAFFREQQLVFVNAHNEALEVGAEWGLPGLLVLGWALWVLFKALRREGGEPETRALAWGGVAALAILSLVDFPLQVALVAFPALLFLSGVLSESKETV